MSEPHHNAPIQAHRIGNMTRVRGADKRRRGPRRDTPTMRVQIEQAVARGCTVEDIKRELNPPMSLITQVLKRMHELSA